MAAKWVEALLALQKVDMRQRELEQRLALLPREMSELKARRDAAVADTHAAAQAARKIEAEIKNCESEIARLQDESRKLQQQSALVKKNTEYQAMLNTVALNAKKISDLESRVLKLMDDFEAGKAHYRKVKTDNDAVTRLAREEFEELLAFAEDVKKELARLRAERPELARKVDSDTMTRYKSLLKGKNAGAPLVKIENGICGHCHLRITPQAMNGISKGAVTVCDNCMHLIYDEGSEEL